MRASTFPYKGKCLDGLRFWMVAGLNWPRRDFRVACMYRKWGVENLGKTSVAWQVTALPIFKSQLNISTRTCVYDSILQGQNLPDLERDHFSLRTPLHDLSDVFFKVQCMQWPHILGYTHTRARTHKLSPMNPKEFALNWDVKIIPPADAASLTHTHTLSPPPPPPLSLSLSCRKLAAMVWLEPQQ